MVYFIFCFVTAFSFSCVACVWVSSASILLSPLISVFTDQCQQQCNGYCHKSCNHTDNKTCHVEVCCIGINIHFLRPPYLISRPICCRYVSDHKYCCHSFHLTYVQSSVIHLEDCYNSLIFITLIIPFSYQLFIHWQYMFYATATIVFSLMAKRYFCSLQ